MHVPPESRADPNPSSLEPSPPASRLTCTASSTEVSNLFARLKDILLYVSLFTVRHSLTLLGGRVDHRLSLLQQQRHYCLFASR